MKNIMSEDDLYWTHIWLLKDIIGLGQITKKENTGVIVKNRKLWETKHCINERFILQQILYYPNWTATQGTSL